MLDLTPRREDLDPIEVATREEIAALQLVRLKETVKRVYDKVPHYRKAFDAAGVLPQDLKSLADLAKFPFTTKADLRANYPFEMFATPQDRIVRIHASSGTTGKPTVVGYTQADIETWSQVVARSIRACRCAPRHEAAQRLRLWPLHRRPRPALRRRAARPHHHPRLRRHDRAPGAADRRLRARHHHRDAVLHAGDPRRVPPPGPRPAHDEPEGRHLRRRALDRRHARRDRAGVRHACRRHLWPVGGDRPGRRQRVRRDQGWAAHLGGPFLPGDYRSGDGQGTARRRAGRAGLHHAHQGGHAGDPLSRARPHPAAARLGAYACGAWRRSRAAPTTC